MNEYPGWQPPADYRPPLFQRMSLRAWLACWLRHGGHDWLQTWRGRHECLRCGARTYREPAHDLRLP